MPVFDNQRHVYLIHSSSYNGFSSGDSSYKLKSCIHTALMQGKNGFVVSVFHYNVYASGVLLFDNLIAAVTINGHIWRIHVHMK